MTDLILREFNGKQIRQRKDGFLSATDMCHANGKRFYDWYRLESTQEYIKALENEALVGNSTDRTGIPVLSLIQTVKGKYADNSQGVWIHELVATDLAMWLSPIFRVQVNKWVKEILTEGGAYNESATLKQLEALQEKNLLMQQKLILEKAENRRVTQLNHEVSQIDAKLIFIIKVITEKLIQQATTLGSMVMSEKKEKAYYEYWQVIYALHQLIPDIFPEEYMHTKKMLDHSLTDENVALLFDKVALKGRDIVWETSFKNFHDFNLSEN
jgi:hypothetical protein